MLHIEIDGKTVEVENGCSIIEAADKLGVFIPRFCYHKKLSVAGNCRMCLVEVEKFPRPVPACATPVMDGMKVSTRSNAAVEAQKSVMEFLLINHPLDCPICDQGGECDLQDIAVAFGSGVSRYTEEKRVVLNKNFGPLVSSDMTRCIQCTRCVRFLREIGGMMELGLLGRGEHVEISAYVDSSVDSELSGNIIDLCPVGALTSKPFRYAARNWELIRRPSIAPHDGLGSQIELQIMNGRVLRVLPREDDNVNECWLSDRDRFSYDGLSSPDRLTTPMIKRNGEWSETDWKTALEFAASRLKAVSGNHGGDSIGVLVSPNATLEEGFIAKKLAQGLGCGNIDHRLRQCDFRLDGKHVGTPWLGCSITEIQDFDRVLVIGSNLRNEHPLLANRLRKAVKLGAELSLVNPVDDNPLISVKNKVICAPDEMVSVLLQVLKALSGLQNIHKRLSAPMKMLLSEVTVSASAQAIAESLAGYGSNVCLISPRRGVFLGNIAAHHPRYSEIFSLSGAIASLCGATFGLFSESSNSVGANLASVMPEPDALNARAMLESPRKAYLLVNVEPELDCHNARQASLAMAEAQSVVVLTAYRSTSLRDAEVLLPITPFSETSGTYISMEGRIQSFTAALKPMGECRPAWKVLRVLGNVLGLSGFDYNSTEDVCHDIFGSEMPSSVVSGQLDNNLSEFAEIDVQSKGTGALQRVGEVPLYQSDAIVRRSAPLQKTKNSGAPVAAMNGALMSKLGLSDGIKITVKQGVGVAYLKAQTDERVPDGCVRVATAHAETVPLGDLFGEIVIEGLMA